MKLISLKEMKDTDLISSTLADIDTGTYPEWIAGTTYSAGDFVSVSRNEEDTEDVVPIKKYQCVLESTGKYPPDDDGTYWLCLGASNKWAMFDQYVVSSSKSATAATETTPSTFTVKINTSKTEELGLFNIDAKKIYVKFSSDNSTYTALTQANFPNETRITRDYYPVEFSRDTKTWTDYLFGEFTWKRDIIIPIPKRPVSYVEIKFEMPTIGEYAGCGMCVCGTSFVIGKTQYGGTSGISSFSRKETDEYFGYTYLKKGNNTKRLDIDVMIENKNFNKASAVLAAADGLPVIIQGNNDTSTQFEPYIVYGFIKSFDVVLEYFSHSECSIEARGLL